MVAVSGTVVIALFITMTSVMGLLVGIYRRKAKEVTKAVSANQSEGDVPTIVVVEELDQVHDFMRKYSMLSQAMLPMAVASCP